MTDHLSNDGADDELNDESLDRQAVRYCFSVSNTV